MGRFGFGLAITALLMSSAWGQTAEQTGPTDPAPPYQPQPATPTPDLTGVPWWQWPHLTGDWVRLRHEIDEKGFLVQANLAEDFLHNFIGGLNTRGIRSGQLFNFNITLDMDKLAQIKGGKFFINFLNENGRYSERDVDAAQNPNHNDGNGTTQVSEAWYQQNFWMDRIQLKAGKMDANNDFAYANGGTEFLNGSFGFSPTIVAFPSYPQSAFGANAYYLPKTGLYAGAGVYDGALQDHINVGERGPATLFDGTDDFFLIGEVGAKWTGNFPGRGGVGVWDATGTQHRFNGGSDDGTQGFYAVLDQTLWRSNPADIKDQRGISFFAQYGYADPSVSLFEQHIGGGVIWTGPLPKRDMDIVGAGVTYVDFTSARGGRMPEKSETIVEGFYKIALTPFFSVKPDVEYVHNPDGRSHDDALVLTVRFLLDF
jgi:porin